MHNTAFRFVHRRRKGGAYPLSHPYGGHFGLVRLRLSGTRSPKPREVPGGTGMTLSRTQARPLLLPASPVQWIASHYGATHAGTGLSAIELTKRRAFFAGARWRRASRAPS